MLRFQCSREAEVIRAAWSDSWPGESDPGLVAHAAGCAVCSQAVALAEAFRAERERACLEANVPPAGLVWWKAQLRARHEAARRASRPILVAQLAALVSLLAAALVLAARLFTPARAALDRFASWVPRPSFTLPSLDPAFLMQPGVLLVCAAALLLAPVAVYLAVSRD